MSLRPLRDRAGRLLPLLVVLAVGACRTSALELVQGWRWDRAGATEETFARDRHYCLRGATGPSDAVDRHYGSRELDADRFATCMTLRGYTRGERGRFGAAPLSSPEELLPD